MIIAHTIAEILDTLKDFEFYDVPSPNRTGGGVGIFLRKGFTLQAATKALIGGGGVHIHIFTFCPTNFF